MNSFLSNFNLNDCLEVLKKKLKTCNFEVNSYKICPLDERKGFLGDYYYLKVNYCKEKKEESTRFFIKVKVTSGVQRDFLDESGAFVKECRFYQNLVRDISESGIRIINECVPACYFISEDQYLIFEDLGAKGYIHLNPRVNTSLDYMKSVLDALAKLHCSGLLFEEKMKEITHKNYNLLQTYAEIFAESFFAHTNLSKQFIEAAKEGADALIDLGFKNSTVDVQRFKKVVYDVYNSFFKIVEPSTLYRNTICHGDLWCTNLLSKFENGQAVHSYIIDFQMFRYGPPAQDFMMCLYMMTDQQFRQENIQHLIEYYYQKMSEIFKEYGLCPTKILPCEEFVDSCNYYKVFALALAVWSHQLTILPEDVLSELFEQGTAQKMIFEGRAKVVKYYWEKYDLYKKKMLENINEFADILIETKQL